MRTHLTIVVKGTKYEVLKCDHCGKKFRSSTQPRRLTERDHCSNDCFERDVLTAVINGYRQLAL